MRLTNGIRQRIVAMMIKRRFETQVVEIGNRYVELFPVVYRGVYEKEDIDLMNGLPESYLGTTTSFKVMMESDVVVFYADARTGLRDTINTMGFTRKCKEAVPVRVIFGHTRYQHYPVKEFGRETELFKRWKKVKVDSETLHRRMRMAIDNARAVMDSVTTDKRLIAAWPESEPFVRAVVPKQEKTTALAVPMGPLNEILGLP